MKYLLIVNLVALFFFDPSCMAQLTWDSKIIEVKQEAGTDHINAAFKFRNTGQSEIYFKDIITSCGCTSARADKKSYPAGSQGEIDVRVDNNAGLKINTKTILVSSSNEKEPLTLAIKIIPPPIATIEPSALIWGKSDFLGRRSVVFSGKLIPGLSVTAVQSSDKRVSVSFNRKTGTEDYEIWVEPVDVDKNSFQTQVVISTNLFEGGKSHTFNLPVDVQR